MARLDKQLIKNLGLSTNGISDLRTWMGLVETALTELKADYNAHCADATSHAVADTTNTLAYSVPAK